MLRILEKQNEKLLLKIAVLAPVYIVTGELGLKAATVPPHAAAVSLQAGVGLAALLVFGYELWPGVWLGAFVGSLLAIESAYVSIGIADGNMLEVLTAAYLINRFANGRKVMNSTRDVLKFSLLAGLVSTTIGATFGATSLVLGGFASLANFGSIWFTRWIADGLGVILVAPVLVMFASGPRERWNWRELFETTGLIACVVAVGLVVFGGFFISADRKFPLEFVCIPFLVWAAFRFGQRQVSMATLALSITALWAALHRSGVSVREPRNGSLAMLQAFVGVMAVFAMALAAEFSERKRAEEQARFLAASDPLTGLGNYRNLFDSLNEEIKRSTRTHRPFAFLLMDMDSLKSINDEHGHMAGDRALCRLAKVLRSQCRELDTAARYGGDEFALVMPEAGEEAARQVARRIRERLASDREFPSLSVSIGAAVFPEDGRSIDTLLRSADRDLYDLKTGPVMEARPRKFRATSSMDLAVSRFVQIKSQTQ